MLQYIIFIAIIVYLFFINKREVDKVKNTDVNQIKKILEQTIVSIPKEDEKNLVSFDNDESRAALLELLVKEHLSLKMMSKKLLSFLGFLFSNKSSNHLIKNCVENSAIEKLKSISANNITSILITKIYKFGHIFYLNIKIDDIKNDFILMRKHNNNWLLSEIE